MPYRPRQVLDAMGRTVERCHHRRWKQRDGASHATAAQRLEPVPHPLDQDSTIIAVIEMSQASWLVAGIAPGLAPSAEEARTKRGGIAPFIHALACGGHAERPPD